jgi:hypothetical protein
VSQHVVRLHTDGSHPVAGELTLEYTTIPLPADPGLKLTCYTAEPASPTAEKLALLASWAATPAASRQRSNDA